MNVISGNSTTDVLIVTARGFGKRVRATEFRAQRRGGVGVIAMKLKKKHTNDRVSCLRTVASEEDEILVITNGGIIVRQQVSDITSQSRTGTGITIQKLDEGDFISSVSILSKVEDEELQEKSN